MLIALTFHKQLFFMLLATNMSQQAAFSPNITKKGIPRSALEYWPLHHIYV
jgi:hypothetical protein